MNFKVVQNHVKIYPLSDSSGYYAVVQDISTSTATILRHIFTESNSIIQNIPSFSKYAYDQLKITDTQFFLVGLDPIYSHLLFYKVTFLSTAVNWANKIECVNGPWSIFFGESLMSSDFSKIYSFVDFGSVILLYFNTFNATDGAILNLRYKSNNACTQIYGSALYDDYISTGFNLIEI